VYAILLAYPKLHYPVNKDFPVSSLIQIEIGVVRVHDLTKDQLLRCILGYTEKKISGIKEDFFYSFTQQQICFLSVVQNRTPVLPNLAKLYKACVCIHKNLFWICFETQKYIFQFIQN
jgi:hypothetical protein